MSKIHWTNAAVQGSLPAHRQTSRFSEAQWRELIDEDRFALSTVSILLATIIGLGMLGMALVVGTFAFDG